MKVSLRVLFTSGLCYCYTVCVFKVLDSIQQNIPLFFFLECLLSISATVIHSFPFRQTMKVDLIVKL